MKYWTDNMHYWPDWKVKNFQAMMEHAENLKNQKLTPEEALQSLIDAGIFDENGNYTEPYKALEQFTVS